MVFAFPFSTTRSFVDGISTAKPKTARRKTRRFLLWTPL